MPWQPLDRLLCGGLVDSEIVTRTVDMGGEDITKGTTESGTAAFA